MIHFIGAGPGAADLLTVRAARLIRECPVCLYAGTLVPEEIVALARGVRTDTAPLDLDAITARLVSAHEAGWDVARLHSGDVSFYSAIGEQMDRLDRAGVPYRMVPGVPAFAAAAAALNRPLTRPGLAQSVTLARWSQNATPVGEGEELEALARTGGTLCLHLARAAPGAIRERLVPILGGDCPTAVVARAGRPGEEARVGTLGDLEALAEGVGQPVMILIGRVLGSGGGRSHLYSVDAARARADKG